MQRLLTAVLTALLVAGLLPGLVFADAPAPSADPVTLPEDAAATPITLTADDPTHAPVTDFTVTSGPSRGALGSVGPISCPGGVAPCSAVVDYTPDPDTNGADGFDFTATNVDDESAPVPVAIAITPVNDAPSFAGGADQAVPEDAGAQAVDGWATGIVKGPANEGAQALTFHVAAADPSLFLAGPAVSAGGTLTFTPAPDAYGTTSVDVYLQDDAGGDDTSATGSFSITVTSANDAPTAVDDDAPVAEDSGASAIDVLANDTAAPDVSETLTVTGVGGVAAKGTPAVAPGGLGVTYAPNPDATGADSFTYTVDDGNGGTDTATVSVTITGVNDPPTAVADSATVLEDAAGPTIDVLANDLIAPDAGETLTVGSVGSATHGTTALGLLGANVTYTPEPDTNGVDVFTYTMGDGNGGSDTATVDVTITPVNDPPSFTTLGDQVAPEDAGPQVVADFATGDAGPPDESGQALSYAVTNDDNALFASQPAIAADGTLSYTPAADATGSTTVTVHASDDGGTANSGVDASADQAFTVTVTAVNDVPVLVVGADRVDPEDAPARSVPAFATKGAGAADEAGQATTFHALNDHNALFSVQPAVAADGTLTYTPAPDANGTATVSVWVTDDGGTAGGGGDTSAVTTFSITLTGINDQPSFTPGAAQSAPEDAGAQAVASWATDLSAGPGDEAAQALSFAVTGDTNPGLFAAGPAVDASGTLTWTPAPDANGTASVSIRITDGGGTASGGVDASASEVVTFTVAAVNDAPSFTSQGDITLAEDGPAQTTPGWATGSAGPADEAAQALDYQVTDIAYVPPEASDLFTVAPAVASSGTLTFTPRSNRSGVATVTVRAHDDGGTANGGLDTSAPQTFTITISGTNDPPRPDADIVTVRLGGPQVLNVLANDSGGLNEVDPIHIVAVQAGARGIVAISPDGQSVTYDPVGCTTGGDRFSYTIADTYGAEATEDVFVTLSTPIGYPFADGPRPSFVGGSTVGSSTAPVKISWCGVVSGTTLKGYTPGRSINGSASYTTLASTTATSTTQTLGQSPTAYRFRVRITDKKNRSAYGVGPGFRIVRAQDTPSASLVYSPGWKTAKSSSFTGGTARYTSTKNASATFTYTGRAFAIIGPRSSSRGTFTVYVDGVRKGSVSEKASSPQYRRVLYTATLAAGTHLVRVVAAGGHRVDIDAFLTIVGY